MKVKALLNPYLYLILYLCLLGLLITNPYLTNTNAQSRDCFKPPPIFPPDKKGFRPGSTVKVIINPTGFDGEEIEAIKRGVLAWQVGITWTFELNDGLPPSSATATDTMHIKREEIASGGDAQIQPVHRNDDTYVAVAYMFIDPRAKLTTLEYIDSEGRQIEVPRLQPLVSHETGHPLNLANCDPACNDRSIMGARSYKVNGPTPCDYQGASEYNGYPPPPDRCTDITLINTCYDSGNEWDYPTCDCVFTGNTSGGGGGSYDPELRQHGGQYCHEYRDCYEQVVCSTVRDPDTGEPYDTQCEYQGTYCYRNAQSDACR